jgi:hypothetical protein
MSKLPGSEGAAKGLPGWEAGLWVWCLSALLVLVTGCSHLTSAVGRQLPARPAQLAIGQSHLGEFLRVAGPPSRISAAAGGFAMLYEYDGVDEKQLGFNVNIPILNWFKFVGAKSWLEHQAWLVTFDTNGVLRAWGEEHWRKVFGTGGGVQILITVSSLVDSSQVRRPAPQHDWGKAWLAPPPKVLNTAQSPDHGAFGLEQTLTPTAIGERTLEMTPPPRKFPKKK